MLFNPFQVGESFGRNWYFAFLSHSRFVGTLSVIIPLELVFVLLNNFFWGLHNEYYWHIVTKPMPMILIIFATFVFIKTYGRNLFRLLIASGLLLSLIADIFLLFEGEEFFLAGLGVFFLAHVMYTIAFSISQYESGPPVPMKYMRAVYFIAGLVIVPAVITRKIMESSSSMVLYAVISYSCMISILGWRAAARIGYSSETLSSQILAFVGSLFFIISDTLLAFNRFYCPIPYEKIFVLTTYWFAQTLFVISLQREPWHSEKISSLKISKIY